VEDEMPSDNYGPFRGGTIETGSGNHCPCGKKNQHSLREGGECDFRRRPKAEQEAIKRRNAGKEAA
jgi:hypothetical protein